jgi:hypothetical protein
MTLSTPIKIIVATFAVAALVNTAMSGSGTSAGLKGSRNLQAITFNPDPSTGGLFANFDATAAINTVTNGGALGITPAAAAAASKTVAFNAAGFRTGDAARASNIVANNAALLGVVPVDATATSNIVTNGAAISFADFDP